jgi:hypothetical protein
MYCPRCGQKQSSAEAHFCNSCGFPLDRVKELLVSDSVSPALEEESQKPIESPRRKGVRQGVKLLFICLALAPLTTLFRDRRGDFLPMMFFMAGVLRILYAIIFQQGAPRKKKQDDSLPHAPITPEQLGTGMRGSALPPPQGVPVATFKTRRVDTAEMVTPPSVTEHTTKLLNESQDSE